MKATPLSNEPYYPLILANGKDGVLINYDGSNFVSRNGHTHDESHQGAPFGWYKMSTSALAVNQQPVIRAGIQVIIFGAPAEPKFFEQSFDAKAATVNTLLTFAKNIKISVDAFITSDSIWCEKVTLLENPDDVKIDLGFEVCAPDTGLRCMQFKNDYAVKVDVKSNALEFTYNNQTYQGRGVLIPSVPFDDMCSENQNAQRAFGRGMYKNVKEGFSVERAMICVGAEENIDYNSLVNIAQENYTLLHVGHKEAWKRYFSSCKVEISDEKLKQIYDLSRYIIKAHQHPETGLISLGMLPNLWQGGICCAYDESFPHDAFLTSGNFEQSMAYTKSYLLFADDGRKVLAENGVKGISFYGWTTTDGKYVTHYIDKFEWLTHVKPLFSAYCVIAIYSEWLYHPEAISDELKEIVKELLLFYTDYMLIDNGDVSYIRNVQSATEAGYAVEVDSFTQALFATAFKYAGVILNDDSFTEISKKMYFALNKNINAEGVLLPHEGAPYIGGTMKELYKYTPNGFEMKTSIDKETESGRTPWGLDNDMTTEEYRHWPWNDSKTARCYIRLKESKKAMEFIKHLSYGASSLGALPEKIRLDGVPINYYYTSAAALFVAAINESFACDGDENEIIIAGGVDASWQSFSCRNIRVSGNISVSLKVENGKMIYLKIQNNSNKDRALKLSINTEYIDGMENDEITLRAGAIFEKIN